MRIKLEDFEDLQIFCKGIEFFGGTVDVKQGRHIGNARSFLQMCSMDLSEPIDVTIDTENKRVEENFYKYLKK